MINSKFSIPKQNSSTPQSSLDKSRARAGFTIIELLIATAVFSVILLLIAEGVLSFNNAYYKGVTQSNTQNTARSAIENISQAIQFSGGQVTLPIKNNAQSHGFCIGNKRYSYLPGWQLVGNSPDSTKHQAYHALVMDTVRNCSSNTKAQNLKQQALHAGSTELLSPNMRVAKLTVLQSGTTDLYSINIRVAYGDDSFLYSPSGNALGPAAPDATCHADWTGVQFCATAELSTVVEQRIAS